RRRPRCARRPAARPRRARARAARRRGGRRAGRAAGGLGRAVVGGQQSRRGEAMTDRGIRSGALLALATGLISGGSVYLPQVGTQAVPDPFVYTTARNAVVGAALLALVVLGGGVRSLGALSRADWGRLGLIAVVGGSVPFLLFFWGLTLTSAPTASFIQKTQF